MATGNANQDKPAPKLGRSLSGSKASNRYSSSASVAPSPTRFGLGGSSRNAKATVTDWLLIMSP